MDVRSAKRWILTLNDVESLLDSIQKLGQLVVQAKSLENGRLTVCADGGERPWWHRILGARRWVISFFALDWKENRARLIFHDEDWSEYRASDPAQLKSDDVVKTMDEWIVKDRAFEAVLEFLESGSRPSWLSYRFVE
jgi:hypothetical protein